MRQSVRDAFVKFSAEFEGTVPWLYLDILGLVTVGIGNLVDPIELAMSLPFSHMNGYKANRDEIAEAWDTIKNAKHLAHDGHFSAEHLTDIRLTQAGIESLALGKLDSNWSQLLHRFDGLEDWPADAQLGLCSMAWAAGPLFRAPLFDGYCRALDFKGAATECHFNDTNNPGLRPRNAANERLFYNASNVIENGMDRNELFYPTFLLQKVDV